MGDPNARVAAVLLPQSRCLSAVKPATERASAERGRAGTSQVLRCMEDGKDGPAGAARADAATISHMPHASLPPSFGPN